MKLCVFGVITGSLAILFPDLSVQELTFDDGSRKVCSAVLRMCSPVFEKMLASGAKKIEVKAATAPEFDAFYSLLMPGYFRSDKITE
ncbi:hypothetical protein AK812_SmicGene44733, partial [Symbiodinium microadriaticum]